MQILGLYYHRLSFVILSNTVLKIFAITLKFRSASGLFVNAYDNRCFLSGDQSTFFGIVLQQKQNRWISLASTIDIVLNIRAWLILM
ncbi:hypothetical protein P8452_01088 [Trifolium repens]|nr:hypothetical protein P8452_01088 [Trifolium repens]